MSEPKLDRVEDALAKLPEDIRKETIGVLYGYNCGSPIPELSIPPAVAEYAKSKNFQIVRAAAGASREQTRPPRLVRIGLIQNRIVLPTTAPVAEQWAAIRDRCIEMVEAAAMLGVNIVCMQE